MATTLTDGTTTIILPEDLRWIDEFTWTPIIQKQTFSIDGFLIVEEFVKESGRQISIEGASDRGWILKSTLDELKNLIVAGKLMTLTIDERNFEVMWDIQGNPLEATKILDTFPHEQQDFFSVKLKFIEV